MSRKNIPVKILAEWRKDPEYVKAYNALEEEFSLAKAMIEARAHAGLTQDQLAERMHTTQAVIARPRERPGEAVDAHARAPRRGNRHAAKDFIRAGAGAVTGCC